jgi:hypothetical protein
MVVPGRARARFGLEWNEHKNFQDTLENISAKVSLSTARSLNQTSIFEKLSAFGDKRPHNGSKNDLMAPRTTL